MSMPVIRLRQSVQFPANVYGGTGIAVSKVNGNYTIDLDYSEFGTLTGLPSSTTTYVLSYDTATHAYVLVPAGNFLLSPSNAAPAMDWVASAGVSALYSRGDHVHPSDTSRVAIVPQTLSAAEQTQARQNVYAAPLDALAYNGIQINGSMEVSQERGFGTPLVLGGAYFCDGWQAYKNGAMAVSAAAYNVSFFPGFSNFGAITVQTAQPALTSNEYVFMANNIEGYRIARLAWGGANAQPITIGFWTRHTRTGTYTGSIRNAAVTRSYVFSYTQNVSDASEYKTVTIPGCTDGVWEVTNLIGLGIVFTMAAGPSIIASSLNTWLNVNALAGPGQINAVDTTSSVFRISGVVVLPGIEAPSAARSPFIMRPYDQELVTCQRYFYAMLGSTAFAGASIGQGFYFSAAQLNMPVVFPTEMRAAPTSVVTGGTAYFRASRTGGSSQEDFPGFAATGNQSKGCLLYSGGMAGTAGIGAWILCNSAAARIFFDARL